MWYRFISGWRSAIHALISVQRYENHQPFLIKFKRLRTWDLNWRLWDSEFQYPQPCSHLWATFLYPLSHAILPSFSWNSLGFFQIPGFPCPLHRNFWNSSILDFHTIPELRSFHTKVIFARKMRFVTWCHGVHKQKVTRLPPPCIAAWGPSTEQGLTMIWISLLQTCRSYSLLTYILFRAHFTPLLVLTRNTIAKPPIKDKITCSLTRNLLAFDPNPVPARGVQQEEGGHWAAPTTLVECSSPCPSPELPALPGQLSISRN